MKKVNLNNLYESPYPPTDINTLWVDKDESTGKIRAIHKYNIAKGEWEPDMVSVNYMKPTEPEDSNSFVVWTKEDFENSETRSIHMLRPNGSDPLDIERYYCIVDTNWKCEDTEKEFIARAIKYDTNGAALFSSDESDESTSFTIHSDTEDIQVLGGVAYIEYTDIDGNPITGFYLMTESQYEAFSENKSETTNSYNYNNFLIAAKIIKK